MELGDTPRRTDRAASFGIVAPLLPTEVWAASLLCDPNGCHQATRLTISALACCGCEFRKSLDGAISETGRTAAR
jgi:hypothetical protein